MDEVLAWRVKRWRKFDEMDRSLRCEHCRIGGRRSVLRETPIGVSCVSCWLERESCEVCKIAPWEVDWEGQKMCRECLCPDILTAEDLMEELIRIASRPALNPEELMASVQVYGIRYHIVGWVP